MDRIDISPTILSDYSSEDDEKYSFDTISNCYSMPMSAIGKNDAYLTGAEASMFLEFHASSYQQYHTWNDDDEYFNLSQDVYFGINRRRSRSNKTTPRRKSLLTYRAKSDKGKAYKYGGGKKSSASTGGQKGHITNGSPTLSNEQSRNGYQLDKSNSTLASTSAKFRSIESLNSVVYHDAHSSGGSYEERPLRSYKVLFEAQVQKVNKLEKELASQNDTIHRLTRAQDNELGENRNLSSKVIQLQKNLEKLTQNLALTEARKPPESDLLVEKEKTIQELSTKLAKEMANKLASNEENFENIKIKNRPMNVANDYEILCSNQWLHAKNILDDQCINTEEGKKVEFMCSVFMLAEKEATDQYKLYTYKLKTELDNPLVPRQPDPISYQRPVDSWLPLPSDLINSIGDYLRDASDKADLSKLTQTLLQILKKKYSTGELSRIIYHKTFITFVEACVRLAWKMALQRPCMTFSTEGVNKRWNASPDQQELYWGSSIPKNRAAVVKYYVHPMFYHGKKLMVKGRVFVA